MIILIRRLTLIALSAKAAGGRVEGKGSGSVPRRGFWKPHNLFGMTARLIRSMGLPHFAFPWMDILVAPAPLRAKVEEMSENDFYKHERPSMRRLTWFPPCGIGPVQNLTGEQRTCRGAIAGSLFYSCCGT